LSRSRNYDDDTYVFKLPHPRNAPEWTYIEQDTAYETDFEGDIPDIPNWPSNDESQILIDINEEHQRGESSVHGEIHGAILQSEYEALQRRAAENVDEYAPLTDEDYDEADDMLTE